MSRSSGRKETTLGVAGEAVWALLVVSDPAQSDTLADQEKWASELAAGRGWNITRTFSGVSSGKSGARALALRMLDDLEALSAALRPKRVLMIRLERLGRGNGLEAMEAFLRIRRLGIIVHTRLDGDVGYERASELLMPVLRFFIGGMENEVRRDKLNASYAKRRKENVADNTVALSNRPPYGLAYENGHYVPKYPEATAVRLAYELKIQGFGSHLIAKRLAPLAPPMELRNGLSRPQHWTADRVRRLIIKPAYKGILVDHDVWHSAQRQIREVRRPTIRNEYALGGALTCECGYALIGHAGSGKRPRPEWRYYQCRNLAAHGRMKHHRTNRIEGQFLILLQNLAAEEALLERYVAGRSTQENTRAISARIAALREENANNDQRRRKLYEAFEQGDLRKRDLQWRLDDLAAGENSRILDIEILQHELAVEHARCTGIENARILVRKAADLWSSATIDDKRALAKAIAQAIGGLIVTIDGNLMVGEVKSK